MSHWTCPNDFVGHERGFRGNETHPSDVVAAWSFNQAAEKLFVSAITIGEVGYGLHILPEDKRRSGLQERFERFVALAFDQRALAYIESAARLYGELLGDRKELGLPMSVPDGQIAAIARLNHLAVATRNVLDFEHCGIEVINPFGL